MTPGHPSRPGGRRTGPGGRRPTRIAPRPDAHSDRLKSAPVQESYSGILEPCELLYDWNVTTYPRQKSQNDKLRPDSFSHLVRCDERQRRVEMHLIATRDQSVRIPLAAASCDIRRGETNWTESSYKFDCDEIGEVMQAAGFRQLATWIDEEWPLLEGLWLVYG